MEIEENDNEILKWLFLKRFGLALPEVEEKDDVDLNMDLIDLTKENDDEMEDDTTPLLVPIVKREPIEVVIPKRLRKSVQIEEKEAPENVIAAANNDTDMAEANSVNPIQTAEQIIAESDAVIAASQ